jgi:uncharacterized membrane protein HdeD (DUF308 family)
MGGINFLDGMFISTFIIGVVSFFTLLISMLYSLSSKPLKRNKIVNISGIILILTSLTIISKIGLTNIDTGFLTVCIALIIMAILLLLLNNKKRNEQE